LISDVKHYKDTKYSLLEMGNLSHPDKEEKHKATFAQESFKLNKIYSTFLIINLIYKYYIKEYIGYIIANIYSIYGLNFFCKQQYYLYVYLSFDPIKRPIVF
jgi:hypothetical protein